MRILFDRNVEPKYIHAIESIPWVTTDHVDDHFAQNEADSTIGDFAEDNGWVVFTRDEEFFNLGKGRDCGFLFIHQNRNPPPREVAAAIEKTNRAHPDPSNIHEPVPGLWL